MPGFFRLDIADSVARLTLTRPDVHNAFNAEMIVELRDCFRDLAQHDAVRAVVLAGEGPSFCAGGDLNWMRSTMEWSHEQQIADASALADLFQAAWDLPKPLIGRVHGAAIGGGVGLVACCDIAIASENARFGLSEVKLGLVPAIIAQYVVPIIGMSQARALFVTGERFSAQRALQINLVHEVVAEAELDTAVDQTLKQLRSSGPQAIGSAKRLVDAMWQLERDAARNYVIEAIVQARGSEEGQAGMRAFLEKRKPEWNT
jgi:methylglutaconyl-CoA hydratase